MPDSHNELLMNIPDEDLQDLVRLYEEKSKIPCASNILLHSIRIRKNNRSYFARCLSPGIGFKEDGTFFVLTEFPHRYDLAVFSLDPTGKNIYEGLMKTKRIHFDRPVRFCHILRNIYPVVLKVISDRGLKIELDKSYYVYTISKTEALEFTIECPEDLEIKRLTNHNSSTINSSWTECFCNSKEYIESVIELNACFGLFAKSSGDIVSWALQMEMGQIGIIQTVQAQKRNGYASLIAKRLAKELGQQGEDPIAYVETSDVVSQGLFERLGFSNVGLTNDIKLSATV